MDEEGYRERHWNERVSVESTSQREVALRGDQGMSR